MKVSYFVALSLWNKDRDKYSSPKKGTEEYKQVIEIYNKLKQEEQPKEQTKEEQTKEEQPKEEQEANKQIKKAKQKNKVKI